MNPNQQKGINLLPKDYVGNVLMTNNLTGQKYIATPNAVQQQQANATQQGQNPITGTNTAPTGQNPTTGGIDTIGSILGGTSATDDAYNQATGEKSALSTAIAAGTYDDPTLRAQKQAQIQREIDATNAVFGVKRAEVERANTGRLGQLGAIQARRGLLGSNIAAGQEGAQVEANTAALNAIENERLAAIVGIERAGNRELQEELAKRSQAALQGADAKIAEIQGRKERSNDMVKNKVKALLAAGLNSKTLTRDQIAQAIGQNTLITTDQVINELLNQEAEQRKTSIAATSTPETKEFEYMQSLTPEQRKQYEAYQKNQANLKLPTVKATTGTTKGTTTPYSSDLDALVGRAENLIQSKNGKEAFQNDVKRSRNEADRINSVATVVLRNSPAEIRNDFNNQTNAIRSIDKAIALIDNGVKTGVINNAVQYGYNVFGKDFDPKLAAVNSYITSAIQPYRNTITGAAWGEQEDGEYASLFGSTKYSPKELKDRLVRIKEIMKDKTTGALNNQINPMSEYNPFIPQQSTTTQSLPTNTTVDKAKSKYGITY